MIEGWQQDWEKEKAEHKHIEAIATAERAVITAAEAWRDARNKSDPWLELRMLENAVDALREARK